MSTKPSLMPKATRLFSRPWGFYLVQSPDAGCGTGGNLIPHAFYLPDSELLGIDLRDENSRYGRNLVQKTGLENIELVQGNILDLDSSLGLFDYIIAHGLFSWVPGIIGANRGQ